MENLQGNFGIDLKISTLANNPFSKAKQWTIIFVNDHGEVISFNRFKEAFIISLLLLFISIIAAIVLIFLYINVLNDNNKLQIILSDSQQRADTLKNEYDNLMARLIILESKLNGSSAKELERKAITSLDNNSLVNPSDENIQFSKEKAGENPVVLINNKGNKAAIISVKDFIIYYEKENNILKVQYIIKNETLNTKISGYTVAILKTNNETNQNEWVALPNDNLIEGKPSGKVGQAFLISNYRKIKFKVTVLINPEQFTKAAIYVFSENGELLLQKDITVTITIL